MKAWFRDVLEWLRAFPRANRRVTIDGSVFSKGGVLIVSPGIQLTIMGDVVMYSDFRIKAGAVTDFVPIADV
jgi:hypothetical protein